MADAADVVQLEIRGVGGATAQEILGGSTRQTSGDGIAGFYAPDIAPPHGRMTEAYEWGRLTSGTRTSSVWWILLPFTLINVAGWMFRPSDGEQDRRDEPKRSKLWWGRLSIVVAGLAMTATYVLWLITIGVEIVVFGCSAAPLCADRWYTAPVGWFDSNPAWLAALGTGVAAVAVLGLFVFIVRTQDRLEGYETDAGRRLISVADSKRTTTSRLRRNTELDNQAFWYKWQEHRRLFRWHLGLAMVLLGGGAAHAMARLEWRAPPGNAWLAIGAICALIGWLLWVLCGPERFRETATTTESTTAEENGKRVGWMAAHAALAVLGYGLGWAITQALEPAATGGFAYLGAVRGLSVTLLALALATLATLMLRRPSTATGWPVRLMPGVAAALAIVIAGAGFVAVAHLLGRFLLGSEWVTNNGFDIVLIDIFAVSVAATLLFVLVRYLQTPKPVDAVSADYFDGRPTGQLTDREREWAGSVASARVTARLLGESAAPLAFLTTVMALLGGIQLWRGGFDMNAGPDGAFAAPLFKIDGLRFLHAMSATVIVLYVFPGVQLIRANARSRDTRRQLGKVWDVLSFWPRRFHPLAAPCYAERAVPEFRNRVRQHLAAGRKVIVSAHSQGTVIAFAALAQIGAETDLIDPAIEGVGGRTYREVLMESTQAGSSPPLDPQPLRRVALVTFGCPLSRLYGRFFAWHFGASGCMQVLRNRLATLHPSGGQAWRSLYRPTDYIGQEVFVEPGGVLTPADVDADIRIKEAAAALFPFDSHSNYERAPQLTATVDLFAAEM